MTSHNIAGFWACACVSVALFAVVEYRNHRHPRGLTWDQRVLMTAGDLVHAKRELARRLALTVALKGAAIAFAVLAAVVAFRGVSVP